MKKTDQRRLNTSTLYKNEVRQLCATGRVPLIYVKRFPLRATKRRSHPFSGGGAALKRCYPAPPGRMCPSTCMGRRSKTKRNIMASAVPVRPTGKSQTTSHLPLRLRTVWTAARPMTNVPAFTTGCTERQKTRVTQIFTGATLMPWHMRTRTDVTVLAQVP